ncbi:hypothetical protein DM01DRAFT_1384948 [Hesseltinella vesiculosa]|uniref:Septin-type G domain-containing protein n=1 Tax=Hesseltinella vesiculosa TaxID=101127 RepID=A0A1X2GC56_9FUNG|nr:hypothetical protein DM01DRAFT_1384948 [Hesseltinella vesiculosa]
MTLTTNGPGTTPTADFGVKSISDDDDTVAPAFMSLTNMSSFIHQPPPIKRHRSSLTSSSSATNMSHLEDLDVDDNQTDDMSTWTLETHQTGQPSRSLPADQTASPFDLIVPRMTIPMDRQQASKPLPQQYLGYFRIMICGDSGIGKTALIQAMRILPDIIGHQLYSDRLHDPTSLNFDTDGHNVVMDTATSISCSDNNGPSHSIKEYYASTINKPSHLQDLEDSPVVKNLCLIDTPGYGDWVDAKTVIRSTAQYLERQFHLTNQLLSPTQPNTKTLKRLLHNDVGGHTHVDACLYLILDRLKRVDLEYLRAIHELVNVIPVIVKSDLLSREQESQIKRQVLQDLNDHDIHIFTGGPSLEDLIRLVQLDNQHPAPATPTNSSFQSPYTQSSSTSVPSSASSSSPSNHEALLPPLSVSTKHMMSPKKMNPGGTGPQPPSSGTNHTILPCYTASSYTKLVQLRQFLFETHLAQLRHDTTIKFMNWRREQNKVHPRWIESSALMHQSPSEISAAPRNSDLASGMSSSGSSAGSSSAFSDNTSSFTNQTTPTPLSSHMTSFPTSMANLPPSLSTTIMLDLETMTHQGTTRELAERINELRVRQERNIHLRLAHYVHEQRQRLDQQMQDRLLQMRQSYHQLEQQEKSKFLLAEWTHLLAQNGLLIDLPQPDLTMLSSKPKARAPHPFPLLSHFTDLSLPVQASPWVFLTIAILAMFTFWCY